MSADPYLFFNGNCADAMRFYERTLGGKLDTLMTYGESPEGCPETTTPDKIMHATLVLPGGVIMASDRHDMSVPYEGMNGFGISLDYPTLADAKRVFDALAEGGQVWMPFDKTFWSDGFGMVADRFGTPWMVSVATKEA